MVCKITSTKPARRRAAGFAMTEALFAAGVTTLMVVVLCNFIMFSSRSFAALYNYVDLDDDNRVAIDRITRDVRQANRVKSANTSTLVLEDADGLDLTYAYNTTQRTLTRTKAGVTEVILKECDRLTFTMGQRNAINGTYDIYETAAPATCKVVNVSWLCSRGIFGLKENTESVQTARIVIRNQKGT
ncbi:MAG: hypothetical protein L0Y58_18105 [Verrucomicrobia subdivision 3 bacterium]|nr:hypothetical protein [Limisphaerales bacterium]